MNQQRNRNVNKHPGAQRKPVPHSTAGRRAPNKKSPSNRGYGFANNTSLAYDTVSEETPEYMPQRKKLVRKLVKKTRVFVYKDDKSQKLSKLFIITLGAVFLSAFLMAMSYAIIYDKQQQIKNLSSELKELKHQNDITKQEIADLFDKEELERIATETLGMIRPKPFQIIHIDVPRQSYVVTAPVMEVERKGSIWQIGNLADKFKDFINKTYAEMFK